MKDDNRMISFLGVDAWSDHLDRYVFGEFDQEELIDG